VSTRALGLQEIAGRLATRPPVHDWVAVIVSDGSPVVYSEMLALELQALGLRSIKRVTQFAGVGSLIRELRLCTESILVIAGMSDFQAEHWKQVDLSRTQLRPLGTAVILLDPTAAGLMARNAPHFFSWFGSEVWTLAPDVELLSTYEKEQRLRVLRESFGKTDDEVIQMVREARGGVGPDYAEWIVLLDRSELL
jgi:hypothetical protein